MLKVYILRELLEKFEAYGYSQEQVKCGTTGYPFLWAFADSQSITLKTALDFDANDLKEYTEQYYQSGKSPYAYDEEFAEHLMDVGISDTLVREALGEAWAHLYFKCVQKRLEERGKNDES